MIRVGRINQRPPDIQNLRHEADRDGIRNVGLLVDEWISGAERFDKPGEALFAAFDGESLIGVGGVTIESDKSLAAMRMRRLYVLRDWRKRGVGRMLADAMIAKGFERAALLTCNARATLGAAEFWDALGFFRVTREGRTHEIAR